MKSFWTKKYNQNIAKMIGICYRYVPVRATAEDIAHDAFLCAIEKADTYKGLGSFEAWLTRITVNKAVSYLHQHRETVPLSSDVADAGEEDETVLADGMMSAIKKAEFTQEEIMEAIAQLPWHHRTVLNLYVFERHTHAQIAELLGISVNTSKSHLLRARRHLQKILFEKSKQRKRLLMFIFPIFSNTDKAFDSYCRQKMAGFSIPPHHPITMGEVHMPSTPSLRVWLNAHALPIVATGIVATSAGGLYWATRPSKATPDTTPPAQVIADSLATDVDTVAQPEFRETETVPEPSPAESARHSQPAAAELAQTPSDTPAVEASPTPVVVKKVVRKNKRTVVIKDSTLH